jgi:AraC family transcriptional regulator of adaptative response / DNA-3-methyladenine glycosylase II
VVEDFEKCYRAVQSKDPRFDGWFFTAVTSTGIYCRPSCPATTPKRANVRFYPTAASAQQAGFRACKRCRPDAAPGSPEWDTRADVVARAMRLIADGVVDREGVGGLARRLGYGARQLERLLLTGAGAGPLALARAQRAQVARVLIETTGLPMAEVAFAAGFSSVRQFNGTVRAVFALSPSQLRQTAASRSCQQQASQPLSCQSATDGLLPPRHGEGGHGGAGPGQTVVLRLAFRAPLCVGNLFGHLAATAVPGVEEVRCGAYRRTLRLVHGPGIVALRPGPGHIWASVTLVDMRDLPAAVARCRRLLDLDADPEAVDELLSGDPALAPLVRAAPGRRVPRTVDEAEMAVRTVLGQQVSIAAARARAGRLAAAFGSPLDDPGGGLSRTFPDASVLAEALRPPRCSAPGVAARPEAVPGPVEAGEVAGPALPAQVVAGPRARQAALAGLVEALAEGRLDLGPGSDREEARARLSGFAGIGPWTVETIAMRALGDPDAFPTGDLGLRRGAAAAGLVATLSARAVHWRPWRSYATQYLWAAVDHPINHFPLVGSSGPRPGGPSGDEVPGSVA